jgi:hypothetical protein
MRASTASARPRSPDAERGVVALVEGVEVDLLWPLLDTGHVAVGHRLEERCGLLVRLVGSRTAPRRRSTRQSANGFAWRPPRSLRERRPPERGSKGLAGRFVRGVPTSRRPSRLARGRLFAEAAARSSRTRSAGVAGFGSRGRAARWARRSATCKGHRADTPPAVDFLEQLAHDAEQLITRSVPRFSVRACVVVRKSSSRYLSVMVRALRVAARRRARRRRRAATAWRAGA